MKKIILIYLLGIVFISSNFSIGNEPDVTLNGTFTGNGIKVNNREFKLYMSECVVQSYYVAIPKATMSNIQVSVSGDTACSPGWIHGPILKFKYKGHKYAVYEDNIKKYPDFFEVKDIHYLNK